MSNLRNLFDYFWPPVRFPNDTQSESSSTESSLDDDTYMSSSQLQESAKQRGHRHDRRTRDDNLENSRSRLGTAAGGGDKLSAVRDGNSEIIELQPVRPRRRRGEDGSPAIGFYQRIRDLEISNSEQRKLADDRQLRIRVLEKENNDLKSQADSALRRLHALQSANNTFISSISTLERELHTLKVQHAPCSNRIVSAETRYSALLSAHTVLQSTYNDVRSSHQALQSSCTSLQMSHSALLFSHSVPFMQHSTPHSIVDPMPPIPHPQSQLQRIETSSPAMSRESSMQTSPTPDSASSSNTGSDVSRLKTLLNDRTSELTSLQTFLSKHDEWSGAQVVQAVKDLNGEISRLAAAVSEHLVVIGGTGAGPSSPSDKSCDNSELQSQLCEALGSKLHSLIIAPSGSSPDPSLMVQFALQAWEIWCCTQILEKFCFGLPDEVEKWLAEVWESMKAQELQPMSSRWRGLTHGYLRTSLQAVEHKATQLPTPPASPYLSAKKNPRSLLSKRERELFDFNIKGIQGILNLISGGSSISMNVEEEIGDSVKRIQEQAINIARVAREGVMSGWFELVRVPGVVTATPSTDAPSTSAPVVGSSQSRRPGQGKGKGKMNHRKVLPMTVKFDKENMENVFKGFGREEGPIMCTVEFGLVCVRKEDKEDNDTSVVDTDGGRKQRGEDADAVVGSAPLLERRMLIKPRVLLESADEIL